MEREEQETKHNTATTTTENNVSDEKVTLQEEPVTAGTFQTLRTLIEKIRSNQPTSPTRRELSRDKSKSFLLLAGASVALLLILFGVFSSPKTRASLPGETTRGGPSLGGKTTPGQQNDATKTVTPMLNADVREGDNAAASQVTPQDVGGTSPRYNQFRQSAGNGTIPIEKPSAGRAANSEAYALKKVDFSDSSVAQPASVPNPPGASGAEHDSALKKPSMVFVRSAQSASPAFEKSPTEDGTLAAMLPAGTRLVARLEAPVSSAVPAPVIAVVEYNYERDGEIVLPAGSRVFGKLSHVNPSGFVGFQFDRMETPEGTTEKIEATAMDLKFGPIKGSVSGRNRGKNFLVRSVTGIGTVAAYVVGGQGTAGFNEPISENSLLRERLADNIGMAGQDEINTISANQNIVVTVPGNTRFYVVAEKAGSEEVGRPLSRSAGANNQNPQGERVPTLEELRELIQLRSELNQMYSQTSPQAVASQQ